MRGAIARAAKGESVRFESSLIAPDGQERAFAISLEPIRNGGGKVVLIVPEAVDITERWRSEKALHQAKEAAEAANRSKDRFLAVLSHELRTPLTPVLMSVSAMEHDPELPLEVREDLAMIKRNIELETKLIDDLLDLSRITSAKLALDIASVDLNETVRHVCGICRPQIHERGVHLVTRLDPTAGQVPADSARLQQVLWNVLKNVIKFTPEGGGIDVSTKRLADDKCEVRVTDSGMGIPADVLPRIFDAFEQGNARVTRQFGGLGLGLAISKAIIELHGGSIRAESAGTGSGATFVVELPCASAHPFDEASDSGDQEDGKPRKLRLLLVEDHSDTARADSRAARFRLHGFNRKRCGRGEGGRRASRFRPSSQ